MKIKEVSTNQFAGIRKKSIEFNDGINVIYGKNETGKTTLVHLITALLFQNHVIDRRTDKAFISSAFPARRSDGEKSGERIDGKIVLEDNDGEYTLEKTWGKKSDVTLDAPNGFFGDPDDVSESISEILKYGKGVYSEILLAPQGMVENNLESALSTGSTSETQRALTQVVTKAFAESDGISFDELKEKIDDKISKIQGKYWDIDRDRIKPGYSERSKQKGEVAPAYQALEDAEEELEKAEEIIKNLDNAQREYIYAKQEFEETKEELEKFDKISKNLVLIDSNEKLVNNIRKELSRYSEALREYPENKKVLEKAEKLQIELNNCDLVHRYETAKEYLQNVTEKENKLKSMSHPSDSEIKEANNAEKRINKLQAQLSGMELAVKIQMLGGNTMKITSLVSGNEIEIDDDITNISEAVHISIPDVLEMDLMPADIDADEVSKNIADNNHKIKEIFTKYDCDDVDELEQMKKDYDLLCSEIKNLKSKFSVEFGKDELSKEEFSQLEKGATKIGSVREKSIIDEEISELCGYDSLDSIIGSKRQKIEDFKKDYSDESSLRDVIKAKETERDKLLEAIKKARKNVPEDYQDISDSEEYRQNLKDRYENAEKEKEEWNNEKIKYETRLKGLNDIDSLREDCEQKEREFNEKHNLLYHWIHISEVLEDLDEDINSNPLQSLADAFEEYLNIISDKNISAHFSQPGRACFDVISGDFITDIDKLSAGTKETVYLAYRFAVLDYLFPDGGGVIVLDDPMTDMDMDRVNKSCELIKKCAEKHQVILLTCREEYAHKLGKSSLKW